MGAAPVGRSEVEAAVAGDPAAVRALVVRLSPIVRVAIARTLFRYRTKARRRDLAQEVEDLAQETFAALFENGARVLASWDPLRGAALETFVRLVAERTALGILRSGKRSPFTEDPTIDADLEIALGGSSALEERTLSRDLLVRLDDHLKEHLTPRGYELFQRLYVDDADVDTVGSELGMAKDAVYAWKYRFGKLVGHALAEIVPPSGNDIAAVEGAAT